MAANAEPRPVPGVEARRMGFDDLDVVERIERAAYDFPWSRGNFADSIRSGYDAWLFDLQMGPGNRPLARYGPGGVGPAAYALVMWAPDEAHLLNVTVDPAMHGQGIGRAVMRWLLADAAARGAHRLLLEVRPSNPVAIALYDRCGFVRIGIRRGYYPAWGGAREDAIVMECPLR